MSKWLMLVFFTFITNSILWAQQDNLEIRGTGSAIYVEHVVTPKENFYSVGRMFNVNPKDLAGYNHLHFASGLNIGQILKIPLTKNNFTQQEMVNPNEALVPIYHTVTPGETLYRLGVNYNKVSLALIKKWNHMAADELNVGHRMIVGFLKVDKEQSPLAQEHPMADVQTAPQPVEEKPVEKSPEIKTEPASTAKAATAANTDAAETQPQATPTRNIALTETPAASGTSVSEGYFKNLYERQINGNTTVDKSGTAGVFKSTSGWQDEKYYCFSNDAAAGTVLKITDIATGKSIYAKVLDAIPDISQNDGLVTVISNAAAEKLGSGNNKFDCSVQYARQ